MPRLPKYVTDQKTFNAEFERIVSLRQELKLRLEEVSSLILTLEDSKELPEVVDENIENLKLEASNLATLLSTSQTYADSIETYYTTWAATKEKIDEELIDAKKQNKLLKVYSEESENLKQSLESELIRSKSLLDDARQTLDIVTNSALSSVFKTRSNDRKESRKKWGWGVTVAILLFIASVAYTVLELAEDLKDENDFTVWILKLALVTPFIYILFFVTRQYTHERDLEEKYAFKSLVSQTIQNNTKLLRDEFMQQDDANPEVELKIVDFTIESLRGIYREPYNTTTFESKFKFNPSKSSVEAEAKQKES